MSKGSHFRRLPINDAACPGRRLSAVSAEISNAPNQQPDPDATACSSWPNNYFEFMGNRTAESDIITVDIDLTDPDDLAKKLDMIDLTEDETDVLLEQAQQLNVWLRQQLSRQSLSTTSNNHPLLSAVFTVSAPAVATVSDSEHFESRSSPGGSILPPLIRRKDQPFAAISYSRNDHSPVALTKARPETKVPAKLTASLSSAATPRLYSSTRKGRVELTE